jgi:hypothetical protein
LLQFGQVAQFRRKFTSKIVQANAPERKSKKFRLGLGVCMQCYCNTMCVCPVNGKKKKVEKMHVFLFDEIIDLQY